ncbi:MAG: exodeoxyribonuclease VII small subunit [Phycisphaerales bacterium]
MAKKKTTSGAGGLGEVSFEEAIERLEAIIDRIERGEVGLEESLSEYERGVGLIRRCREVLDTAEQRIAELSVDDGASGKGDGGGAPSRPMESPEEPPF